MGTWMTVAALWVILGAVPMGTAGVQDAQDAGMDILVTMASVAAPLPMLLEAVQKGVGAHKVPRAIR